MKRGFTLIELLAVTVIIAALAAIVFRLSGITAGAHERALTAERMQRLENCLSGYFAAFGCYPPVPLQGRSRNIYHDMTANGVQLAEGSDDSKLSWARVDAACRAQPVRCEFPSSYHLTFNGQKLTCAEAYEGYHEQVVAALDAGAFGKVDSATEARLRAPIEVPHGHNGVNSRRAKKSFCDIQLWQFGLMSFLLPRYRFMLVCTKDSDTGSALGTGFSNQIDYFKQWADNNRLPCRMDTGISYRGWNEFCKTIGDQDDWQIDLIPSQAACARWVPNLEGIVSGKQFSFFGTTIGDNPTGIPSLEEAPSLKFYDPNGGQSASDAVDKGGYLLWFETVHDGWNRDFYYYSAPPHQAYTLWSAGPNGKTFPPWIDMEEFKAQHRDQADMAAAWKQDDIIYMSN